MCTIRFAGHIRSVLVHRSGFEVDMSSYQVVNRKLKFPEDRAELHFKKKVYSYLSRLDDLTKLVLTKEKFVAKMYAIIKASGLDPPFPERGELRQQ
jgi:hypothetical protein